jgi:hypothetical protein
MIKDKNKNKEFLSYGLKPGTKITIHKMKPTRKGLND